MLKEGGCIGERERGSTLLEVLVELERDVDGDESDVCDRRCLRRASLPGRAVQDHLKGAP
jgi:hypothetical protein